MELIIEDEIKGKFMKTYSFEGKTDLADIVENLKSKGVQFPSVTIEEMNEQDMQSYGSKIISVDNRKELSNYYNSKDYSIVIHANYKGNYVLIEIYDDTFVTTSSNPNIKADELYDETKKNELDEMLSENKEESDTKGFQL